MCCFQSLDGWTWHPCLFYVGCVTNWTICWTVITRGCSLQRTSTFYALLTITCKLFNEGKVLVFLWQLFLWSMEFTETKNTGLYRKRRNKYWKHQSIDKKQDVRTCIYFQTFIHIDHVDRKLNDLYMANFYRLIIYVFRLCFWAAMMV